MFLMGYDHAETTHGERLHKCMYPRGVVAPYKGVHMVGETHGTSTLRACRLRCLLWAMDIHIGAVSGTTLCRNVLRGRSQERATSQGTYRQT